MICEHCQQREASVTITKVQNGEKLEQHYCEVCAPQFHPFSFTEKEEPISLHQLLSGWFNISTSQQSSNVATTKKGAACSTCQLTYRQFLKQGKFGCTDCYAAFTDYLPQMLQRIQAGTEHIEEAPKPAQWQKQLFTLREQLKQLIEEERFEEAITCRDQIRALESKMSSGGSSS